MPPRICIILQRVRDHADWIFKKSGFYEGQHYPSSRVTLTLVGEKKIKE